MAHLPLTTLARFIRKVENIRDVMRHHDSYFGPNQAWHWRRWLQLAERGELDSEFGRSIFSDALIAELRAEGTIRSAADMLAEAAGQP